MTIPFEPKRWQALQERNPFKPEYNLDRFGFRGILALQCGVSSLRRVFADWMHGWIWWQEEFGIDDFPGPAVGPRDMKIVTSSPEQAAVLNNFGHDTIYGGLPFSYISQTGFSRKNDTLLAFPTHSSDQVRHDILQHDYLDFLADQRNYFDVICVSLFIHDYRPEILHQLRKRRLVPIIGADPCDANSLWRTRATLDTFSHVSTNAFGSHVAYALASGCTTSVFTPLTVNDPKPRADRLGLGVEHVEKKRMVQSEAWLRKHYSQLMVSDPRKGLSDIKLGTSYIGTQYKLQPDEIRAAVGWNTKSYLIGNSRRFLKKASTIAERWARKECL